MPLSREQLCVRIDIEHTVDRYCASDRHTERRLVQLGSAEELDAPVPQAGEKLPSVPQDGRRL